MRRIALALTWRWRHLFNPSVPPRPWGRGGMRRLSGKCHEALVLLAQALDRKPHAVAGFEELRRLHAEADTRGSACRDDVARQQRHEMTDIADDLVDPEDQARGIAVLYPLAVDPGP